MVRACIVTAYIGTTNTEMVYVVAAYIRTAYIGTARIGTA